MAHFRTVMRPAAVGTARLLLAAALAMGSTAHAGRSCEARKPTPQAIERGMLLAERTARALDAEHQRSGARVVLLARAGQDLSKYGVHYSHMGWAYRTPEGAWRVAHKLNDCGTAVGSLYRQGLGEFFLDDLWRHEAVWLVPAPEAQARLAAVLAGRVGTLAMHQPAYSMVGYAWGTRYQQSNQWALETLAMAMEPGAVRTRAQAQAWLRARGYEPAVLRIGPLTRLGGRVTAANVAFDDHPSRDRFADRIATVTVDSVLAWMPRAGLGSEVSTLSLDRSP